MKIKKALILSAGFGTRMGVLGKHLPKPLWPIFEKTMIDVHIEACWRLGVEEVFINTHHLHELIQEHVRRNYSNKVKCLYEPEILGSGGAVHNFCEAENCYHGGLLILNADVFLSLSKQALNMAAEKMMYKNLTAYLYAVAVEKRSHYNRLVVNNEELQEICPPSEVSPDITYSGVAIINLDKINYRKGYSSLFESVATYKTSKVGVGCLEDYEYWDFGTKEQYVLNHYKLLKSKDSTFISFLQEIGAVNKSLIENGSYNCSEKSAINLANEGEESSFVEIDNRRVYFSC